MMLHYPAVVRSTKSVDAVQFMYIKNVQCMAKIRREALQGSDGWEGGRLELSYGLGVYSSSSSVIN